MNFWQTVAALIVAVGGAAGLSSLITVRATARRTVGEAKRAEQDADKADAEARKVISEATMTLMQPLIDRANTLESKLRHTESELDKAHVAVRDLTLSLQQAQAETTGLRNQVDLMSKELQAQQDEVERLRRVQHWGGPVGE